MTRIHFSSLLILIYLLLSGLTACSPATQLSRDEVLSQHSAIAELENRLKLAEKDGIDYLAPEGFNTAMDRLGEAVESARTNDTANATRLADEGLALVDKATRDARSSRYVLEEVLAIRERAMKAGADSLYPEELAKLEDRLRESANLIERNKSEKAKELRAELIEDYSRLELKTLKTDVAQKAKEAIQKARVADADRYAPKTLKLAREKLGMAQSVLETDRTARQQANQHARDAISLAEKSIHITELIKDFDRREFTPEDKILWYQEQLKTVNQPLEHSLDFAQPNREVVEDMRTAIASLKASQDLLTMTAQEQQATEEREREIQQRFEFVQSLFKDNEANVYRQRQNVLMSVHGFYFPSGQNRIEAQNFALLNKIKKAIDRFPQSRLVISGHTDARGDDKINLSLSKQRARNVAKFLIETGGISAKRISVQGYGETKPVASNETVAGRSLNRRVEVLIINQ